MNSSFQYPGADSKGGSRRLLAIAQRLWPRVVELWILAVLAGFFLIRVLGSHVAQGIMRRLGHAHLP